MKERELGSMQIANERIVITEVPMTPESSIERRLPFCKEGYSPLMHDQRGGLIAAEWYAKTADDKDVAWAMIVHGTEGPDTVILFACVTPEMRRCGIGKMMLRLGTDQAIRYRKRTVLVEVEARNEQALHILDGEEFEKEPEAHPGWVLLKKELKWI